MNKMGNIIIRKASLVSNIDYAQANREIKFEYFNIEDETLDKTIKEWYKDDTVGTDTAIFFLS